MFSLSACTPSNGHAYAEAIIEVAKDGAAEFPLPQQAGTIMGWNQLFVLCPYGRVSSDLPQLLYESSVDIDNGDDGKQRLVFDTGESAKTIKLDRSKVDFCSATPAPTAVFRSEDLWTAEEVSGTWQVRPNR